MKAWFPEETAKFLIDERMLIMRKGKHNVRIVELISDEEWKKSGQIYPGQPGTGLLRRMKEELKKEIEAKGRSVSDKELTEIATRKKDQLNVANNSDIELPNKHDVRERRARLTWDRRDK
ncbi:tyrosyl-tRNA synthetase [Fusarium oxysporum]|nr:tyrosyl-tRNA synthetase [Fusarium oxysporum]